MRRVHIDQHHPVLILGKDVHTMKLRHGKPQRRNLGRWVTELWLGRIARPLQHGRGIPRAHRAKLPAVAARAAYCPPRLP